MKSGGRVAVVAGSPRKIQNQSAAQQRDLSVALSDTKRERDTHTLPLCTHMVCLLWIRHTRNRKHETRRIMQLIKELRSLGLQTFFCYIKRIDLK